MSSDFTRTADCSRCNLSRLKNKAAFHSYSSYCKVCDSVRMRERVLKNNPEARELGGKYSNLTPSERTRAISKVKRVYTGPCSQCKKERKEWAEDFKHYRSKCNRCHRLDMRERQASYSKMWTPKLGPLSTLRLVKTK